MAEVDAYTDVALLVVLLTGFALVGLALIVPRLVGG